MAGTDLYLSLVDLNFRPSTPPVRTVYAHTLCTNRNLGVQIPRVGVLQIEEAARDRSCTPVPCRPW